MAVRVRTACLFRFSPVTTVNSLLTVAPLIVPVARVIVPAAVYVLLPAADWVKMIGALLVSAGRVTESAVAPVESKSSASAMMVTVDSVKDAGSVAALPTVTDGLTAKETLAVAILL